MNKSDKEKEKRLQDQQAADRALFMQSLNKADTKSPLEQLWEKEQTDWINQTSGSEKPFDVMAVKGMSPYLSLYNNAIKEQAGERQGIGALRLGTLGSNPQLAQLLSQQAKDRQQQTAAGALENAFNAKDAAMRGNVLPTLGMQTGRAVSLANLTGNMSGNSTSQWAAFRPAPSFWSQAALAAIQGAAGAATGGMTGGMSSLAPRVPAALTPGQFQSGLNSASQFGPLIPAGGFFRRGGSTAPFVGRRIIVGEDGVEIELDEHGNPHLVGAGGPEVRQVNRPSFIVPHEPTARILSMPPADDGSQTDGLRRNVVPLSVPSDDAPAPAAANSFSSFRAQESPSTKLATLRGVPPPIDTQAALSAIGNRPQPPAPQLTRSVTEPNMQAPVGVGMRALSAPAQPVGAEELSRMGDPPALARPNLSPPSDASYTPSAERMQSVVNAAPPAALDTSDAMLPPLSPQRFGTLEKLDRMLDEADRLENSPDRDNNGKWGSFWSNFVRTLGPSLQHAQAQARAEGRPVGWSDLIVGLSGAAGAGAGGVIDPASDERAARLQLLAKRHGQLDNMLKRYRVRTDIDRDIAAAEKDRNRTANPAQLVKEMLSRQKITGGRFDPSDARQVEIAQLLNIQPKSKASGGGMNWQRVRTLTGADRVERLVLLDYDEEGNLIGRYIGMDGEPGGPLSEADRRRLAIDLERENRLRAEDGLKPIGFRGDLPAPAPPDGAPAAAAPPAAPAATMPPLSTPRPSDLIPTGAPPANVPRRRVWGGGGRGSGRGGGSGGGSTEKDYWIEQSLNKDLAEIDGAREWARIHMQNGEPEKAKAALETVRERTARLRANKNYRGRVEVFEGDVDASGNRWPGYRRLEQAEQRSQPARGSAPSGKTISRSRVKEYARINNISDAEAEQDFSAKGVRVKD